MLDVGFSEILLTSAIALIVLGPERLPKVARQVGNWMGRARAMARQLSEQLEREVSAEELLKTQSKPNSPSIAPPPPAAPPEPVYGLDAAATTAAAMHASEPPAIGPKPADSDSATDTNANAPATDAKSPP
jgi:sec-independent protein translocase protein TatB